MAELLEYECPCCGGKIEFDSASQAMKCPYCDTTFEMDALKNYSDIMNEQTQDDMTWDVTPGGEWQEGETAGMSVYSCNSCGGEIVADQTTGATSCPYCDSPVVLSGQFKGDLRPDYVIPFKFDKEAAKNSLRKHLEGKWLLPKAFKDENHIDEIKCVYVPFWLFDASAKGRIVYKATRVRRWEDNNYRYKETKFYSVIRAGGLRCKNVPVDGSSKMPDDLMESIEPFNYSELQPFNTAYLSGYLADKYDVTAEDSIDRANQRVKQSVRDEIAATVKGYDTVSQQRESISLQNGTAKYVLCPVWILNTTWNNEKFLFAMNGQTGKFVGNLPVDMGKFWRWLLIFSAILGPIGGIIGAFLG
ncbi:MAG: hypothetical protein IJZ95_03630 [Oscillospiraceae bacterium]|nr:hypothetical protein [Oscillospiraceae bacterium]